MNLIFFLNCVSPHQLPYIKELPSMPEVSGVWVVAPCVAIAERQSMGWSEVVPEVYTRVPNLHFCIAPTDSEVTDLLRSLSAQGRMVGVFNGIRADRSVFRWLQLSWKWPVERGIVTEPPFTFHKPLWMHRVRFALQDWRFVSRFQFVLAIGAGCADYYRLWSHRWQVVPFAYCTEPMVVSADALLGPTDGCLHVVSVSALSPRKNVMLLLDAMALLSESERERIRLTIVGDGPERAALVEAVEHWKLSAQVRFAGRLGMDDARRLMAAHDVLALPSLYDGWGAVVNEALQTGLSVVCSGRCGAKMLIEEQPQNGLVVNSFEAADWARALSGYLARLQQVRELRSVRRVWADEHVSGKALAKRLLDVLCNKIVM